MHLLIPFAAPVSEQGRAALAGLALPNLAALLGRLQAAEPDVGDAFSLSPPHERALARELGLEGADGAIPWAAWLAERDGIDTGDLAWGLLTPAHWAVGSDAVALADPELLQLDDATSRELLLTLTPLFEGDGLVLLYGAPTRWYVAHESLAELPTASPDRVIGRSVERWLPSAFAARKLRRLQSEVQMLLHTHPLNAERERRGLAAVNSFWLSGCGMRQPARDPNGLLVADALRRPALAADWPAWAAAWRALDDGPVAAALAEPDRATLTLAGERAAQRFEPQPRGWWSQLTSRLRPVDPVQTLQSL